MDAEPLKGGLHGQRVHDRRQHAHVVGRCPLHPLRAALQAAEDIAAADHHADLNTEIVDLLDLAGDPLNRRGM